MELLGIGAEASVYRQDSKVIKKRTRKNYRLKQLDDKLLQSRTKKEAKILKKLEDIAPKLFSFSNHTIEMEYLKGDLVRNILDKKPQIISSIAKTITILHNKNIAHGDLTTGNMMLVEKEIKLIDFGLSKTTLKIEDKAVDLHIFKQSLISKHHGVYQQIWGKFLEEYKPVDKKEILKRFAEVESRGKNKK